MGRLVNTGTGKLADGRLANASDPDTYTSLLAKLIPGEAVAAYLALDGFAKQELAVDRQGQSG